MRRREKEITDREEIHRVLSEARVCRVALCDGDKPYLVPLSFVLDGNDVIVHSARSGRKIEILRRNPAVCFEVEEGVSFVPEATPCKSGMRFRTVIGHGVAEFIENGAEKARLLALFGPRYLGSDAPVVDSEAERVLLFRIRFRELTGKRSMM